MITSRPRRSSGHGSFLQRSGVWTRTNSGRRFLQAIKTNNLPRDEEAAGLWTKVTSIPADSRFWISAGRIISGRWEHRSLRAVQRDTYRPRPATGATKKMSPAINAAVNGGCARFIELWNLVFIQYNRSEDGKLKSLGAEIHRYRRRPGKNCRRPAEKKEQL